MSANPDEYQGWTNRETWAVNLWLSNDEGLYTQTREIVKAGIETCREECLKLGILVSEFMELRHAGEALSGYVQDLVEDNSEMARAFGSLWRVNWDEVAQAFAPEKVTA